MDYSAGPIVACSTCLQSNAGLAVLRLSGFDSLSEFKTFFDKPASVFSPRKQIHVNLIDNQGIVLDDVLSTFFPAPNSFTGENVLEISVHGNILNVERIIDYITLNFNFTRAKPGEFTYRAFKNGKLNLSQVEGLDLLLNADSNFIFKQGLSQLNGELYIKYQELFNTLVELVASVELAIDFSDDVGSDQISSLQNKHLNKLVKLTSELNSRCLAPIGSLLEPSIVLFGEPNAGKSTLFNFLVNQDRAIVSDVEGTTRDFLSESLPLDFGRVRLVDTAGIRKATNFVEQEGIKRSKEQIDFSFFKILVLNPFLKNNTNSISEDFDLIVITHADQVDFSECFLKLKPDLPADVPVVLWGQHLSGSMGADFGGGPIEPLFDSGSIGARLASGPIGAISIDGPIEPGVYHDSLIRIINILASIKYDNLTKSSPIIVSRQRELIKEISLKVKKFNDLFNEIDDIAIISSELSLISNLSQELIGVFSPDDVLHHIFNNFCIGK